MARKPKKVWIYPLCYVVEVIDGDTIKVDIDLGQEIWIKKRIVRFLGASALELKEPGGPEARDNLKTLLPEGTEIKVISEGWDKYAGRIDGYVYLPGSEMTIGAQLIETGWAVFWDGNGKQPKPAWPRATVSLTTA